MLYHYSITVKDSKGAFQRFDIVAADRVKAEAKAYELASVPANSEPENCLRQEKIDAVVPE